VWLSMLVYLSALGISHGLMQPRFNRMVDLQRQLVASGPPAAGAAGPPPQVLEMQQIGKQMGVIGPVLNLLMVVVLVLMVFQPGV